MSDSLAGKVAVVTGATRGCGRAIAVELSRPGATTPGSVADRGRPAG